MTRKLKHIIVLFIIVLMMPLSSCIKQPASSNTPGTVSSPSESAASASNSASSSPSPSATEWHSGVKTDYSGLTPYKPLEEKYTRLKDGAIPDLAPSDYGKLIPYIGETMYSAGGYNVIRKYGLMTESGMIVTDPVYSRVYQGHYYDYSTYTGKNVPTYSLTKIPDTINEDKPWESEIFAVCAEDGSWVTPFAYTNTFYTENVIMLVRSNENNDIDVMDYSGKLLYNTKSLGCYSDIPAESAYNFLSGYGEGFIALALTGGRTVFIDALTGKESYTDYTQSSAFSGGLAAVRQNGLYGFINKDFSMIIPPQYMWADYFYNGKSVVQYPDNSYAIIDQGGQSLFENPYYISRWDSSNYAVYDASNKIAYYDSSLQKVAFGSREAAPVHNGWFFYREGNGVTIFKGNEKHTFDDVTGVNAVNGDFVTVYKTVGSEWQEGLVTLDGTVVIPMAARQSITLYTSEKTGETFAIASSYDSNQSYKVYDSSGKILFSSYGYASFIPEYDLFEVNDELSYAFVDTAGRDVFRISLMQYVPD